MRQHNLRKRIDTPHHPGTVVPLSSATFVIEWEVYTRQTSLFAASRRLHPYDYTSLHNGHGKDKQRFRWHVHSPCETHTTVPPKDSICKTYCRTHPTQRTMTRSHLRVSRSKCQATNSGSGLKATISNPRTMFPCQRTMFPCQTSIFTHNREWHRDSLDHPTKQYHTRKPNIPMV